MASEDTEITLGVGRLVGLFFLLAAICGVFLSIGYSLGKSTAREQALDEAPSHVLAASPASGSASAQADDKVLGAVAPRSDAPQAAPEQATASNVQNNLTFYKSVQHNDDNSAVPAKGSSPTQPAAPPVKAESSVAEVPPPTSTAPKAPGHAEAPAIGHAGPVTGPGTIVVQIAALTREDDAVALAGALRKKDYSVIVVKNPAINDRFYHVQVGPFSNMKDAEAMKARLVAEGYNPILKK